MDTTDVDDASGLRERLGAQANRIATTIYKQQGEYGRVLSSLWQLRLSDAPGAQRHFAVAQASTVPLLPATGGLGATLIAAFFVAGFVSRRLSRPAADRFVRALRDEGTRLWSGPPLPGAGGADDDDDGPRDPRDFRSYKELMEYVAPGLLEGEEGVYKLIMIDRTMRPLFFLHDTIEVEAVQEFKGDGIYLYEMEGSWHVKRIRGFGDVLRVMPVNDKFAAYNLTDSDDWQIYGRVVGWSRGVYKEQ